MTTIPLAFPSAVMDLPETLLMPDSNPLKIAVIGFGTVGSGVARLLSEHQEHICCQAGRTLEISRIVVRDASRKREWLPAHATVSTSIQDVANDPEIDLVVQLVGGIDPAHDYMTTFLKSGKDIVTANKALIYEHGDKLFQLAESQQRTIGFEAAVAGGIPIVGAISQSLTGNKIHSIEAILNGTSNFILTRMLNDHQNYDDVLKEAQALGYAEADPSMDVDGTDAAQKLAILSDLAFATPVRLDQFTKQGIEHIQLMDLQVAAELGFRIKLLATARRDADSLELALQPTLVDVDRTIAQTDGADNIVTVDGSASGRLVFAGAGAGQLPTASAVVADIIDYATGRTAVTFRSILKARQRPPLTLRPADELRRSYYLRFSVDDRPHVLADITDVLGRNEISLSSVRQDPSKTETANGQQTARLVMMTHETSEGQLRKATAELQALGCIRGEGIQLPVA